MTGINSTSELSQLLNQWQNALEARRGFHFILEPPIPLTLVPLSIKVGKFALIPKRATVEAGELLLTDTFRVFVAALGAFGTPVAPGSAVELHTDDATLFLAGTSAEGSDLTGTSVTLTLALAFKATMKGQACEVDAAATDDLGNDEAFKKAGKVRVKN